MSLQDKRFHQKGPNDILKILNYYTYNEEDVKKAVQQLHEYAFVRYDEILRAEIIKIFGDFEE